jgi:uncharacterized protein YndB with AHSA1/START domain
MKEPAEGEVAVGSRSRTTDVIDEALIDAPPDEVFRAIVDLHDGKTDWWSPYHTMELRAGTTFAEVGAVVANTVRVRGRFPIRFTTRTTEVVENKMIRVDYVGGAFRGKATWTFELVDDMTLLAQRWCTRPAGMLRVAAPLLPVAKSHPDTMRVGFDRLRAFLAGTPPAERATARTR